MVFELLSALSHCRHRTFFSSFLYFVHNIAYARCGQILMELNVIRGNTYPAVSNSKRKVSVGELFSRDTQRSAVKRAHFITLPSASRLRIIKIRSYDKKLYSLATGEHKSRIKLTAGNWIALAP